MLIPTTQNVKTITDLREDTLGLLKYVQEEGMAYIFHRSKPKAVILSIDDFLRLQDMLEDTEDELDAMALEQEPKGQGIPLEKIISQQLGAK